MYPIAILAGGLATRMRPLTTTTPKALLDVNGEPFIDHQLRLLAAWGAERVVVCTGYLGEQIEAFAGDGARFPAEGHSAARASALVRQVWGIAAELKSPMFINKIGDRVLDDHLALQGAGIPAIDIIDFDYKHWHRLSDVPANCSGVSLEQVARVLGVWLQRVK